MIIRPNGGGSGIAEYLEHGQKQDRFYSRDTLDNRVILHGDLQVCDEIINLIDEERERYFHITLAFKEDFISNDDLRKIATEFRDYYFNSYTDDEVYFYAEAHNPKIKSYRDADGNLVERKPHIHVVVPKLNLVNGQSIDYFERNNIKYVNAFQEYINAKYGSASPKDNSRYTVNENSEFIARYKADNFIGKGKELKTKILADIIAKDVRSFSELEKYVIDNGYTFKYRNPNNPDKKYLSITTPEGNFNLKDPVFLADFLALDKQAKLAKINESNTQNSEYISPTEAKKANPKHVELMQEWTTFKNLECKFLRNLSKKQRFIYKELSDTDKIKFLEHKQVEFYQKYKDDLTLGANNNATENQAQANNLTAKSNKELEYDRLTNIRATLTKSDSAIAAARNHIRNIESSSNRYRRIERNSISGWKRRRLARNYSRGHQDGHTRNQGNGQSIVGANTKHSFIDNLLIEANNDKLAKLNSNDLKKFNSELQADVLLELLAKTHGVVPEKYRITKAANGDDRIGAGTRNFTAYDFLRKELNLDYHESIKLLQTAHNMQQHIDREKIQSHSLNNEIEQKQVISSVDSQAYLRDEFKLWLKSYKLEKATLLQELKTSTDDTKKLLNQKYDKLIKTVLSSTQPNKKEQLSALKVQKLLEQRAVTEAVKLEKLALRERYNTEMQNAYRAFLSRKATENDNIALLELRRLRIEWNDDYNKQTSFNYVDRYQEYRLNLEYKIDKNGTINYSLNNKVVIKDDGKFIKIVKTNDDVLKLSLDIARRKFGNEIRLHGSHKNRERIVELALKNGYNIQWKDMHSRDYQLKLQSQMKMKDDLLKLSIAELNQDRPQQLIVANITREQIYQDKMKTMQIIEARDPITDKTYRLYGNNVEFKKSVNIGEFITVAKDSNNELLIRKTPENLAKYKLREQLMAEEQTTFIETAKDKYQVDNLLGSYSGTFIKSGETNGKPWVVIREESGKFEKIWHADIVKLIEAQQVNKGDKIVIANPTQEPVLVDVTKKVNQVDLTDTPKTDAKLITEIKSIKFKTGVSGYRVRYFDFNTKKDSFLFTNSLNVVNTNNTEKTQQILKVGDFTDVKKTGFNQHEFKPNSLNDARLNVFYKPRAKNITNGVILSVEQRYLRGKLVFCAEVFDGKQVVKKYGDAIKQAIGSENPLGKNVNIELKNETIQKLQAKNVLEVQNLSKIAELKVVQQKQIAI